MGVYPGTCKGSIINSISSVKPNSKKNTVSAGIHEKIGVKEMEFVKEEGPTINYNYLIMGGLGVIIILLLVK